MHFNWKRVRMFAVALCLEAIVYSLVVAFPTSGGWPVFVLPVLAPGVVVQFLTGGGMSMIDGVSPAWRSDSAFVLGFFLNTLIMYAFCLLARKVLSQVHPEFQKR
jgi:hypothetical protein